MKGLTKKIKIYLQSCINSNMKVFSHSYYRLKSSPGLALEEEIVCLNYLVGLIKNCKLLPLCSVY